VVVVAASFSSEGVVVAAAVAVAVMVAVVVVVEVVAAVVAVGKSGFCDLRHNRFNNRD